MRHHRLYRAQARRSGPPGRPATARVPRVRFGGRGCRPTGRDRPAPQRRQAVAPRGGDRGRPDRRRVRHRAHALGHARPADRGERPPPPRLHRAHRRGPQRHHRELPRAEARAAGARPRVRHRDRHRDRGAPHRGGVEGRRRRRQPRRGDAPGAGPDARDVRAGRDLLRRAAEDHRRPQRPAAGGRRRRRRVLRGLGHPGDPGAHPRRGVPRRRGDGGAHRLGRRVQHLRRRPDRPPDAAGAVGPDPGREGRVQALHAEGDLRAAAGGARHGARPRLARHRPRLPRGDDAVGGGSRPRSRT